MDEKNNISKKPIILKSQNKNESKTAKEQENKVPIRFVIRNTKKTVSKTGEKTDTVDIIPKQTKEAPEQILEQTVVDVSANGKLLTQNTQQTDNAAQKPTPKRVVKSVNAISRVFKTQTKTADTINNKESGITVKTLKVEPKKTTTITRRRTVKSDNTPAIKVVFLGGLNQIGKNITAFECGNDIIIVDCGMAFPDGEMLGVDFVIPDFSYLVANKAKIRGLIITHGHEDHIGAVPYLLNKVNVPIYGTPLSLGLITSKLKEHKLVNTAKTISVMAGEKVKFGCMDVEFIHVNHSIPDAVALAIYTPAGTIVHTGDFKIDCTPSRGEMIDLARFSEIGKKGVLALMADSTNADRPGYTTTEKIINESFVSLFQKADGKRIIIATFSSNIGRIQQIINCAVKHNRKVAFSGRSMMNYIAIARQLKYLEMPDDIIIEIDELKNYPKEEVVLITTGSQGEPMSALYRMAFSEHRQVEVGDGDFIIISATPIPGNEKTVGAVVNGLLKLGCEVIHESMYEVHVSGHACQEELKIIQALTKPKYFIPVHGEYRHLRKHAEIAKHMGLTDSEIFVGETGDVIEMNKNHLKKIDKVETELIYVDGIGVGDVGSIVLRDRKHLGQDGLIVAVATLNAATRKIISGPDIVSRGFVYVRESESLMREARYVTTKALEACSDHKARDWNSIKTKVRDDLYKLFHSRTRRNPVILPIIMEV